MRGDCGICKKSLNDCYCGYPTNQLRRCHKCGKNLSDCLCFIQQLTVSTTPTSDPVHHPSHYQLMPGVEAKDLIKQILNDAENLSPFQHYCLGNILKYCLRATKKGKVDEDLEKAGTYIKFFREEES